MRYQGPSGFDRKISLLSICFLLPLAANAATYTTSFPLTENPVSEGGVWTHAAPSWTQVATTPGFAHSTMPGVSYYSDSYAFLSGFGNDQQVDLVVKRNSPVTGEIEALLRFSKSGDATFGYECLLNYAGSMELASWDGPVGTFTLLVSGNANATPVNGDILRAKITGNHIVVSFIHNGSETVVIDYTDANNRHPSGQPGMGFFWNGSGGTNTDFGISQFTARDLNVPDEGPPGAPTNVRIQ
jgi:hypothetical protein